MKPTPILIIGAARNGTTNLANLLGSCNSVASAEHDLHHGSCESSILGFKRKYGHIKNYDDYVDLIYRFSSEDYFLLTQGTREYHLKEKHQSFYDFFFDLMDDFALRNGCRYWLTKLDPSFFWNKKDYQEFLVVLMRRYDNVKWIVIQRDLNESLRSYLAMEGRYTRHRSSGLLRKFALFLQVLRYSVVYDRTWSQDVLKLEFTKLIRDKKEIVDYLQRNLNIRIEEDKCKPRFKINTSFFGSKPIVLTRFEKFIILFSRFIHTFLKIIMLRTIELIRPLPNPSYHRLVKLKNNRESLEKELKLRKASSLLELIKTTNSSCVD